MRHNLCSRRLGGVLSVLLLIGLTLGAAPLAWAGATFTVDSTADAVDANPGDGVCATAAGECTLRAAIQETNALAGADTVWLPAGTYTLTIPGAREDQAAAGDLDLRDSLTIIGSGARTTVVDGNGAMTSDRVVEVYGPAAVTFSRVTIRGGRGPFGGGIANRSVLTLIRSILTANEGSAGLVNSYRATATLFATTISDHNVGGVTNDGTLNVYQSQIVSNQGVGIFCFGGTLLIESSTIRGNTTGASGAGLSLTGCNAVIRDSTITGNRTLEDTSGLDGGAGLIISGGQVVITNSTISNNYSAAAGGGIAVHDAAGGEIDTDLILNSVTITGNHANGEGNGGGYGGGLWIDSLIGNWVMVEFHNTILGGNTSAGPSTDCFGNTANLISSGYNLVGDGSDCTFNPGPGDQVGTGEDPIDPLLGPLQDNGGPTWTHALLDSSPAIDAGNPAGCTDELGNLLLTDQRGFERHVDGDGNGSAICDIGSYEFGAGP